MEKEDIEVIKVLIRKTMSDYRLEEMQERSEAMVLYICMTGVFIAGLFIGFVLGRVW
jgi:hypothetical protein